MTHVGQEVPLQIVMCNFLPSGETREWEKLISVKCSILFPRKKIKNMFQFHAKFYTALAYYGLLGCETLQFDREVPTFKGSLQSLSRRQKKHVLPKLFYPFATQAAQRCIPEGYNLCITSVRTSDLKFHGELKFWELSDIYCASMPFGRRQTKRCLTFHENSQILQNVVRAERCSICHVNTSFVVLELNQAKKTQF